ncbi:NlpC/P60 family protein [Polaribacter aestuariivivens]|uniref:NlpC/P60 family protein n=1 Tax=Polaribacter aestuariivivens TaxID=2304626 RepID=A0A5S3NEE2_9FLAO|nr:C40 family peptidase [Polaribacter aestuariivivens]TMM32269.1 NlpC/P60 family protein [Polaribacter aestuariivivens]
MKKIVFLWTFILLLMSCGTSKKVPKKSNKTYTKSEKIVANALKYKGVKYRFGGITKKGMDCSGIVYVSFLEENIQLPRISRDMAKTGQKIPLKKAQKGDLLFFKTSKKGRGINHVGLIVSVKNNKIRFIHSTTSRGVIISQLSEKYWKNAFVKAMKIL